MEHLTLDSNGIYHIDGKSFSHLPQCNKLNLNDNKLTQIREDMFTGMYSLQKLELSHNQISHIEIGSFTKTQQLQYLYLSYNKLRTLEQDMFYTPQQGKITIFIENNPLQCDSRICWITQGEQDGRINFSYKPGGSCEPNCENNITIICPTTSKLPLIYSSFINYFLATCRVLVLVINTCPANIKVEQTASRSD